MQNLDRLLKTLYNDLDDLDLSVDECGSSHEGKLMEHDQISAHPFSVILVQGFVVIVVMMMKKVTTTTALGENL